MIYILVNWCAHIYKSIMNIEKFKIYKPSYYTKDQQHIIKKNIDIR